jgi:hypothetical protein
MTNSIEDEVETSIAYAITSAGVTGVNVYTSERASPRLLPFVYVDAEINSEEVAPFTGIFDLNVTVSYVARADISSNQGYNEKFFEIQQALYTDPNLASQMTTASASLEFYIANVTNIGKRIVSPSRTWATDILMDVKATAK